MQTNATRLATRVCLTYCLVAGLWILFSDWLLNLFVRDPAQLTALQTYKGWVFVLVTAALLYFIQRRFLRKQDQEISARQRTEDKVRQLSQAIEQSPVSVVITDPDGNIEYVNRKFTELTGYSVEEVLRRNPRILKSGKLSAEMYRQMWSTIKAGGTWSGEFYNQKKNGELYWEWAVLSPILDQSGNITHFLAVKEDITQRKAVMEALQASEERFRQLAENINEVFWITNPANDRVFYISPGYEEIWGQTCESLYQNPRSWIEAIHPVDRPRILEAVATKRMNGTYNEIYRILRPDGSLRWIHDRAFLLRDANGEIYRIVGTAEDITEHKKLEMAVYQSQKMESLGQMAGGIAHDFNNILGAIMGYTDMAKFQVGSDAQLLEYLENISKASRRASDLVKQILTFSRRREFERRPTNLRTVVEEAIKLLRASVPATIDFETNLANVPPVLADATAIHQVMMNLGTNAWHAIGNGPGKIKVELAMVEVDADFAAAHADLQVGPHVRLSVSDSGCGMDSATLERIFDPFFTTKKTGEGTGLGLAVVHGIMKSHEGCISVYSQPQEGTVFHLYFPADRSEKTSADELLPSIPRGNGERVLFVDDEESLALLGKKILEKLGYSVSARKNAAEALALFQTDASQFDLVITDLSMPGMDGITFAKHLRELRPQLPIILTTGYRGKLNTEALREQGFQQLLMKPSTARILAETVHRALNPTLA